MLPGSYTHQPRIIPTCHIILFIPSMRIKQFVDSLEQNIFCNKTSFHPTDSWTSSGLKEN